MKKTMISFFLMMTAISASAQSTARKFVLKNSSDGQSAKPRFIRVYSGDYSAYAEYKVTVNVHKSAFKSEGDASVVNDARTNSAS